MSSKKLALYILISVGVYFGVWVATVLGASRFDGFWFFGAIIGFVLGVYIWFKIGTYY